MRNSHNPTATADILIVDDTPHNLELLTEIIKAKGYKVRPVIGGALALQAAQIEPPDLILLDINMPDMDGYEVCRCLKTDKILKEIPVIFISALDETADKVKAFEYGGADYITKPFRGEEIHARIKTHLQLHLQKRCLQESYEKLRELESLRDSLVHMVVHDMNTPITVSMGVLDMFIESSSGNFDETQRELLKMALASTQKMADMVSQLLSVSRLEAGEMPLDKTICDLGQVTRTALQPLALVSRDRTLKVEAQPGINVLCDKNIVQRIIGNLVGNALKFIPENGEVKITISGGNQEVRVSVEDNGPGIPREFHQKIFEKFGQVETKKNQKFGTGLGLAFCRLAVEAHGGQIGVDSEVGKGSTFWFTLTPAG